MRSCILKKGLWWDKFVTQCFTGGIRKYIGSMKKVVLGSASPRPIQLFFMDPIYFRIPPVKHCITNNPPAGISSRHLSPQPLATKTNMSRLMLILIAVQCHESITPTKQTAKLPFCQVCDRIICYKFTFCAKNLVISKFVMTLSF